jgi:glycosyltransferase involved in cell wall biosynthesis
MKTNMEKDNNRNKQVRKILFVVKESAINRGMNTGLENLAWGLANKCFEIHVLAGGSKPKNHYYNIPKNVFYHFINESGTPGNLFQGYLSLEQSFDAIVGWVKNIAPLSHLKTKIGKKPLFIANQGAMEKNKHKGIPDLAKILSLAKKTIMGKIPLKTAIKCLYDYSNYYGKINKIVSVTKAVESNTVESFDIQREKCCVIYRGIDTGLYSPLKNKKRQDKKFRIIFTGNVIETKGVLDIAKAVSLLESPVEVVFCGKCEKQIADKIDEIISKSTTRHKLFITGVLKARDLIKELNKADTFIFPSFGSEGSGKSLIEAMSLGLPVIVSDIKPFKEIVIERKNGLILEKNNPKQLAKALKIFIQDREFRNYCGKNARKIAIKKFDKKIEIEKWMRILKNN